MAKITKKSIYAEYGIEYNKGKIYSPLLDMWIPRLLINGNKKIGRGVWQYSITAGNRGIDAEVLEKASNGNIDAETLKAAGFGTCACSCPGCYAMTGCYMFFSTKVSLARKTLLSRLAMDWVENAIKAQIKADRIHYVRIHAAGDFFSSEYVQMWSRIAIDNPDVIFWTYTKTEWTACKEFDALANCNIVKSLIGKRVNYGKAAYIIALYNELKAAGKNVYICRCGIDAEQHCAGCHHCYSAEYVLFLEHSTDYKPELDPAFPAFMELVNSQAEEAA